MNADQDDELAMALNAARIAHQVAYAEARLRVLNYLPPGEPDLASLTGEHRRVVQRWQTAGAEYDRLRVAAYEQERQRDAYRDQPPSHGEDDVPTHRAR